jgi:hypothetical protein
MASCYPAFSGPCPYCDDDGQWELEFLCSACEDQGWMLGPDDEVMPCTECSASIWLDDIEEFVW